MSKTVGIAGLGLVGRALAERLLENGFLVRGYDVNAARVSELTSLGVQSTASIRALAERSDYALIAVLDSSQAEQVLRELPVRDLPVLCVTTCEPERAAALAARAPRFVEVPLSGTSAQIRAGTALGLLAGDPAAIADAGAVLDVICPRRFVLGAAGAAARAKLAINLVLQINRGALAEGIAFAERLGIAAPAFLELLKASAARSAVMETKGGKMLNRDYAPESRLSQTLKDAEMIRKEVEQLSLTLPLMQANLELLSRAISLCGPDADPAAVIEPLRAGGKH